MGLRGAGLNRWIAENPETISNFVSGAVLFSFQVLAVQQSMVIAFEFLTRIFGAHDPGILGHTRRGCGGDFVNMYLGRAMENPCAMQNRRRW